MTVRSIALTLSAAALLAGGALFTGTTPAQAQSRYASMCCGQLWYARNLIYANRGYCFRSQRAINAFGPRCYPPYGRLSDAEHRRVAEIQRWERRRGC